MRCTSPLDSRGLQEVSGLHPVTRIAMAYSLGLGLTNECNLACAHCYRPTDGTFRLSLQDVRRICDSLPVASANLGTGENGLHPEYNAVVEHLLGRDIKTSLTTNGYTVQVMPDPLLRSLSEVEFSFDFPTPREQDPFPRPASLVLPPPAP